MRKVLVIDDEITSDSFLGRKIKDFFVQENHEVLFANTWEDEGFETKAKDLIQKEKASIELIFLDILFSGQSLEGGDIFEKLKKLTPQIPVAILTQRDIHTEAEEFLERGAVDYIVKTDFKRISNKFKNIIRSLTKDPENKRLKLVLIKQTDRLYYMDIEDENGFTVLKRRKKLTPPVLNIILKCIQSEKKEATFPQGIEYFTRQDIQQEVNKFNNRVKDSSNGRIHALLKGLGMYGMSAFRLLIGEVEIKEFPKPR